MVPFEIEKKSRKHPLIADHSSVMIARAGSRRKPSKRLLRAPKLSEASHKCLICYTALPATLRCNPYPTLEVNDADWGVQLGCSRDASKSCRVDLEDHIQQLNLNVQCMKLFFGDVLNYDYLQSYIRSC